MDGKVVGAVFAEMDAMVAVVTSVVWCGAAVVVVVA